MSDKPIYPSDAADKVLVRMPDGMRQQLKEAAKANNRTMNAEIVARLLQSFEMAKAIEQMAFEHGFKEATLEDELASLNQRHSQKMVMPFDAEGALKRYQEHLDKVLAQRDERLRSWWEREFGYDPEAPQIKREPNKGPTRSSNAKKPAPPKKG